MRPRPRLALALPAAVVLAAVAWVLAPLLLGRAIEQRLAAATGTSVSLREVEIAWRRSSIALHQLEVASPIPGDERPLLRIAAARARLAEIWPLLSTRTLHLSEMSLDGAELAVRAVAGEPSSLALEQARLRGATPTTAPAPAAAASPAWLRRVEIDRLTLHGATLRAVDAGASGSRVSHLGIARLELRGSAIELGASAALPSVESLAVERAELGLGEPGGAGPTAVLDSGRIALAVSAAPGAPGELAIEIRSLELDGPRVETTADDLEPTGLDTLLEVWRAAARGLELPGVACVALQHGRIDGASYVARQPGEPGRTLRVTQISAELDDLRHPQIAGAPGSVRVHASPFAEDAHLEVRASGEMLAPGERGPATIEVHAYDVPLAEIEALYLDSGNLTASAEMTLSHGVLSGEAVLRLAGPRTAPDAPLGYKAAYESFDLVASTTSPDVTVPFSFELRRPDPAALGANVASAVARKAARSAGQAVQGGARQVGRALRDELESVLP